MTAVFNVINSCRRLVAWQLTVDAYDRQTSSNGDQGIERDLPFMGPPFYFTNIDKFPSWDSDLPPPRSMVRLI